MEKPYDPQRWPRIKARIRVGLWTVLIVSLATSGQWAIPKLIAYLSGGGDA